MEVLMQFCYYYYQDQDVSVVRHKHFEVIPNKVVGMDMDMGNHNYMQDSFAVDD
jgi:hypothetical protein